jgi:hypothetical protein
VLAHLFRRLVLHPVTDTVQANVSVAHQPAGHWLPLERKTELTHAIRSWVKTKGLA